MQVFLIITSLLKYSPVTRKAVCAFYLRAGFRGGDEDVTEVTPVGCCAQLWPQSLAVVLCRNSVAWLARFGLICCLTLSTICSFIILFKTDYVTLRQEHELRISSLEDILGKLTERSEVFMLLTFHLQPQHRDFLEKRQLQLLCSQPPAFKVLLLGCLLPSFIKWKGNISFFLI